MKKWKILNKSMLLPVIMSVAMLFLAGVLISSAVSQFISHQWFSGCVSIVGVILVLLVFALLLSDVIRKKKEAQEGKTP